MDMYDIPTPARDGPQVSRDAALLVGMGEQARMDNGARQTDYLTFFLVSFCSRSYLRDLLAVPFIMECSR